MTVRPNILFEVNAYTSIFTLCSKVTTQLNNLGTFLSCAVSQVSSRKWKLTVSTKTNLVERIYTETQLINLYPELDSEVHEILWQLKNISQTPANRPDSFQ